MPDQIPENIKHERLNRLLKVLHSEGNERNLWFQDQTVDVLVEGKSAHNEDRLTGRTMNGKLVNFDGNATTIGTIVPVHIDCARTFSLDGHAV